VGPKKRFLVISATQNPTTEGCVGKKGKKRRQIRLILEGHGAQGSAKKPELCEKNRRVEGIPIEGPKNEPQKTQKKLILLSRRLAHGGYLRKRGIKSRATDQG